MDIFNNSIDERNKVLLENITNAGVKIDFIINSEFEFWAVNCNWNYTIAAPNDLPSQESLAHELLHIYVELKDSLPIKELLKILRIDTCRFKTSSLLYIDNHLNHCKMIGMYVEAGYKAETFIANYGNFHLVELLAAVGALNARFELQRKIGARYSIDLVTDLIDLCVSVKYLEIQNYYSENIILSHHNLLVELIKTDYELFTRIYDELTTWTNSNSFCNYDFYSSLNNSLANLGFPVAKDWNEWVTG